MPLRFKGEPKEEKKKKKKRERNADESDDDLKIIDGSGRIVASKDTVNGFNTAFLEELEPGDVFVIVHPTSSVEQKATVSKVLGNRSCLLVNLFTPDSFATTTAFKIEKRSSSLKKKAKRDGKVEEDDEEGLKEYIDKHLTKQTKTIQVREKVVSGSSVSYRTVNKVVTGDTSAGDALDERMKKVMSKRRRESAESSSDEFRHLSIRNSQKRSQKSASTTQNQKIDAGDRDLFAKVMGFAKVPQDQNAVKAPQGSDSSDAQYASLKSSERKKSSPKNADRSESGSDSESDSNRNRGHTSSLGSPSSASDEESSTSSSPSLMILTRAKRTTANVTNRAEMSKKEIEDDEEFWQSFIPLQAGKTEEQSDVSESDDREESGQSRGGIEPSNANISDEEDCGSARSSHSECPDQRSGSENQRSRTKKAERTGKTSKRKNTLNTESEDDDDPSAEESGSSDDDESDSESSDFDLLNVDVNEKLDENLASDSGSDGGKKGKKKENRKPKNKHLQYVDPYDVRNQLKKKTITMIKRPVRRPQKKSQTERLLEAKDREESLKQQREEEEEQARQQREVEDGLAILCKSLETEMGPSGKPMSVMQLKRWEERQMYRCLGGTIGTVRRLRTCGATAGAVKEFAEVDGPDKKEREMVSSLSDFDVICGSHVRRSENQRTANNLQGDSKSVAHGTGVVSAGTELIFAHGVSDPFAAMHKQFNGLPCDEKSSRYSQLMTPTRSDGENYQNAFRVFKVA